MNMVLEDEWHDDLDVTRVIQTPKIQSFTGQPDIPLESFNPSAHSDAPTSKERKVSVFIEFLCKKIRQIVDRQKFNASYLGIETPKIQNVFAKFLYFRAKEKQKNKNRQIVGKQKFNWVT